MAEWQPNTSEGEALREGYQSLVESIKRNLDPSSNTVLVVDDERGIRMKVARDLKKFSHNIVVHEASNGKEALQKLADIRKNYLRDPLLIVLDLNMPVMDGWEVIDKLKEDYQSKGLTAGIPILVLSSTSGEKKVALIMKKSVHGNKPGYTPLVSIAKEVCIDKSHYDATGETGLLTWLEYFVNK
jgi:CheY-like chemotaxis protein